MVTGSLKTCMITYDILGGFDLITESMLQVEKSSCTDRKTVWISNEAGPRYETAERTALNVVPIGNSWAMLRRMEIGMLTELLYHRSTTTKYL